MTDDRAGAEGPASGTVLQAAILRLLQGLAAAGYEFVTPTPATHARVLARMGAASTLRDVFGWNAAFDPDLLDPGLFDALKSAGVLEPVDGGWRSRIRVSSLQGRLFVHSGYPTEAADAVFFGPDTYRFARLLLRAAAGRVGLRRIVDLGSGAGVGGLLAAALYPQAKTTLADVNPLAHAYARCNAAHGGQKVETLLTDVGAHTLQDIDLALANPPFMLDEGRRTYRDGGDMHGGRLSLDWTLHTAGRLAPGGRMILYTGSAIVGGRDALREALEDRLPALGCTLAYEEIDPDIFGEELDQPAYRDVDRIAAVGAIVDRP